MKKAMAVILTGVVTLGLVGCGSGSESGNKDTAKKTMAETYTISFNQNNGNTVDMPAYQFLGGDLSGMINYEGRLYTDITLELSGDGTYELTSDAYTGSNGERIEVGAGDGIGIVCIVSAEGTYEDNGDGTVTVSAAEHATFKLETDTYSKEIVSNAGLAAVEGEDSGEYDSDDTPGILDWIPETVFTLGENGEIVTYVKAGETEETSEADTAAEEETAIASD